SGSISRPDLVGEYPRTTWKYCGTMTIGRRRESRRLGRETPGGREHAAPQALQIQHSTAV
ncbi:hypothetical protein AB0E01_42040, partial [Nocardia vinacea]|uniref:hypothetical protein n=1 Tax=Nocardia vinacea TaxID=96468 RepID=UPI0033F49E80